MAKRKPWNYKKKQRQARARSRRNKADALEAAVGTHALIWGATGANILEHAQDAMGQTPSSPLLAQIIEPNGWDTAYVSELWNGQTDKNLLEQASKNVPQIIRDPKALAVLAGPSLAIMAARKGYLGSTGKMAHRVAANVYGKLPFLGAFTRKVIK